jgi:predicted NAD-dependent protein-ADP-ribosyltransferase YbiA (DUF1768 family)
MTYYKKLPDRLDRPMIYLSREQMKVLDDNDKLRGVRDFIDGNNDVCKDGLPAWVPAEVIANALGYGMDGITKATASAAGTPYVWATEFENVHELWKFTEPVIAVGDTVYASSETYYQSQKPEPFDADEWNKVKVEHMFKAIRAKVVAAPEVKELLLSTKNHPLVSIKGDAFWGVHPAKGGQNALGLLWMRLRAELKAEEYEDCFAKVLEATASGAKDAAAAVDKIASAEALLRRLKEARA